MPSIAVFQSTGSDCDAFEKKEGKEKNNDVQSGGSEASVNS